MTLLKKNYIDVMIFNRFSRHRKILNFVISVKRKCFKAISSVKIKITNIYYIAIYKVNVDLIKAHGFLGNMRLRVSWVK